MFEIGDVVKVKKEWLNPGEDPDCLYIVTYYNPDGHTNITTKSDLMVFPVTETVHQDMVYKVGHVDLEKS